ncbi:hypothetical protein CWI38_0338p0020 [Hamiltosporidium tvaerminnensis]|uniref:Uncharacterized protein n=2 Tax=Hamiltosporidium TaxID=1176354 RepID=A0A4Q9LA29_9MICR|nr:hypothetical protein LUQ84_000581 [Hamiltosporidium tvaerminnensis]TBU03453.1 hypothetical protein CWI39_0966p0010 [Hamiltosporidium magnivora]TBU04603.1 hypothetical protein CWI37_0112p0030 [Hamiltosporidium tvaerminnensis]TBU13797.1 hypothetical protein CWI38_0338p0020 [Hamiltosporidium tvaerminnensis]
MKKETKVKTIKASKSNKKSKHTSDDVTDSDYSKLSCLSSPKNHELNNEFKINELKHYDDIEICSNNCNTFFYKNGNPVKLTVQEMQISWQFFDWMNKRDKIYNTNVPISYPKKIMTENGLIQKNMEQANFRSKKK